MNRSPRPIGIIVALSMMFVLFPGPGFADDDDESEFSRPGIYLGLNGVGALGVDRRGSSNELAGGGGVNIRAGSRESAILSWEFEFEWVDLPDENDNSLTYGINAKFYFAEKRLQPYMILGAGGGTRFQKDIGRNTDWNFRMGGGLDYYLTKHWALNSENVYVVGVGSLLRQEYASFSLGAIYRF